MVKDQRNYKGTFMEKTCGFYYLMYERTLQLMGPWAMLSQITSWDKCDYKVATDSLYEKNTSIWVIVKM